MARPGAPFSPQGSNKACCRMITQTQHLPRRDGVVGAGPSLSGNSCWIWFRGTSATPAPDARRLPVFRVE